MLNASNSQAFRTDLKYGTEALTEIVDQRSIIIHQHIYHLCLFNCSILIKALNNLSLLFDNSIWEDGTNKQTFFLRNVNDLLASAAL